MTIFWFFFLLLDLIIPITLAILGTQFKKNPPKNFSTLFGYRTTRSMKDYDSWVFAHKVCGNIWQKLGFAMIPVTIISMLLVIKESITLTGISCLSLCLIQIVLTTLTIFPVEFVLKKREKKLLEKNSDSSQKKKKKKKKR